MMKQLITLIVIAFSSVSSKFIYLNIAKSLYIPSSRFSLLEVNHNFNNFQAKLFDISISFNLTQTTQFNQTNTVFDFLSVNEDNRQQFFSCYEDTLQYINNVYSQYKPCQQVCTLEDIPTFQPQYQKQSLFLNVGDSDNPESYTTMIIDNTFFPCTDGAYQPQLYLWQTIGITIEENETYEYLIKIVCVCLLQLLLIMITYLSIMMSKFKKLKGQLEKIRGQQQAQELLNSFMNA